jgi:hypothetical protein
VNENGTGPEIVMFSIGGEHGQRFQKGVLILLFVFLIISLIITWDVPATGFETSIYSSTPLIFWIALALSMVGGIIIVIWSVSDSRFNPGSPWKYGLLMIFLCYTISLSLFIIRGYYMWAMTGDPATHIGYINRILQEGHISSTLFYPVTHIFLAEISLVTTLDLVFLHKIIPLVFSLLCVVFIYIFVRVLSSNQIEPVMAGIVACTSFFAGHYFLNLTPNILCDLFFPLVLFILFKYFKTYNLGWGITLGVTLIFLPIFHLVPSIFLGLVLLTLWIPFKLHDLGDYFIDRNPEHLNVDRMNKKVIIPLLILIIWSILWYSSFSVYGDNVTIVYEKVIGEGSSYLNDLSNQAITAQQYGYSVVDVILKQYGNPIDLFIISVMTFPLMWYAISRQPKKKGQNNFFHYFRFTDHLGPCALFCRCCI